MRRRESALTAEFLHPSYLILFANNDVPETVSNSCQFPERCCILTIGIGT